MRQSAQNTMVYLYRETAESVTLQPIMLPDYPRTIRHQGRVEVGERVRSIRPRDRLSSSSDCVQSDTVLGYRKKMKLQVNHHVTMKMCVIEEQVEAEA
jgi:hypothetical protein